MVKTQFIKIPKIYEKLPHFTAYKTHGCISRASISVGQIKKKKKQKQSTNIKHDEINIMNIINDNTFNLHNSLLNNENSQMKISLKSELIGNPR